MLEDLLADELTLAIAIGGEPDPLSGAQCLANGFKGTSINCYLGRARGLGDEGSSDFATVRLNR